MSTSHSRGGGCRGDWQLAAGATETAKFTAVSQAQGRLHRFFFATQDSLTCMPESSKQILGMENNGNWHEPSSVTLPDPG
mmetsp:Transcript_19394/g.26037  ORF Transcript_19394/g.26037 Transcript_19394/m.26037 type:complete len:80 (-) Transcript_19394:52-291(-)